MSFASAVSPSLPKIKRALIIGNNDYIKSPKLKCCVNDAQDLRDKLHVIDFQVKMGINLTYAEMGNMINSFINEISKGDLVVFFFAGHGSRAEEQDYLLPIDDANITSGTLLQYNAINAKGTLQAIMGRRPLAAIFLLDCCRHKFYDGTRRANDSEANLAIHPVAGSLVAYACAEQESARDDGKNGRNGVFTSNLLKHIGTPNLRIEDMMCYVCKDVIQDVPNGQTPVRHSALSDPNIYFNYRLEALPAPPAYQNPALQKVILLESSETLHLNGMNLTDDDMQTVVHYGMKERQKITVLNLAENKIGPTGAKHLAEVLKTNETIQTIYLTENQLKDEGARYLADALLTNKRLATLGLGQNEIGDQGAQYLIQALRKNTTLNTLYLEFNLIGTKEKNNLIALRKMNKKLNISW